MFFFALCKLSSNAQVQPEWTANYAINPTTFPKPIDLVEVVSSPVVLCSSNDTTCGGYLYHLYHVNSSGVLEGIASFDTVSCFNELGVGITTDGIGRIFVTATDSDGTFLADGLLNQYDDTLGFLRSDYLTPRRISEPFISPSKHQVYCFGGNNHNNVYCMDTSGTVLWFFTDSVAFTYPSYKKIFITADSVFAVGNGYTGLNSTSGHLWMIIADTLGNRHDTVQYDKYTSGVNSLFYAQLLSNSLLAYGFKNSNMNSCDIGVLDRSGQPVWERNVNGYLQDAAVDTTAGLYYALFSPTAVASSVTLFRINIITGVTLDSHIVQVSASLSSLLAVDSAVGVYVIVLDSSNYYLKVYRYNIYGLIDFRGTYFFQNPYQYLVSAKVFSDRALYITGYDFGLPMMLVKFSATPLAVPENRDVSLFEVYPNPCEHYVRIKFASGLSIKQVHCYDLVGRMILDFQLEDDEFTIETSQFQNGIYLIDVITIDGLHFTQKLIIQHQ